MKPVQPSKPAHLLWIPSEAALPRGRYWDGPVVWVMQDPFCALGRVEDFRSERPPGREADVCACGRPWYRQYQRATDTYDVYHPGGDNPRNLFRALILTLYEQPLPEARGLLRQHLGGDYRNSSPQDLYALLNKHRRLGRLVTTDVNHTEIPNPIWASPIRSSP